MTSNRNITDGREDNSFCVVPSGSNSTRVWKRRNRQNVAGRELQACSDEVGSNNSAHAEEECFLCFFVHYRKLNDASKREVYPILRMEESINSLGEDAVFSKQDANNGYWQVDLESGD